jgi:hypothetical protein
MRKTLLAGSVAAAALLSTSAFAQPVDYYNQADYYAPAAAAVTGTVVGLGFSEGWWSAGGGALATTAGAAAVGGLAGIGTLVFIHAVTAPCQGLRIFVDSREECAAMHGMAPAQRRIARRYR